MVHDLDVIIPMRNESSGLNHLIDSIKWLSDNLDNNQISAKFLILDNNSTDNSYNELVSILKISNIHTVKVVKLIKNVGLQSSILLGLKKSRHVTCAVWCSDQQEPREKLLEMVLLHFKTKKIIIGRAIKRSEPFLITLFRRSFYRLLDFVTDKKIPDSIQDFYVFDSKIRNYLSRSTSQFTFIRKTLVSDFDNIVVLDYQKENRRHGKSKFGFSSLYRLAVTAIFQDFERALRLITVSSFCAALLSGGFGFFVLIIKLVGINLNLPGWASLVVLMSLAFSLVFILMSIVIELIQRIYENQSVSLDLERYEIESYP
jgi:hypothetical protein